jgi:hypothetical protein
LAYKITPRLIYPGREVRAALGCGLTKYYQLINTSRLDAVEFGGRTYITGESLLRLVESLKPVITPTMRKESAHSRPRPKPEEDEANTPEKWAGLRKGALDAIDRDEQPRPWLGQQERTGISGLTAPEPLKIEGATTPAGAAPTAVHSMDL